MREERRKRNGKDKKHREFKCLIHIIIVTRCKNIFVLYNQRRDTRSLLRWNSIMFNFEKRRKRKMIKMRKNICEVSEYALQKCRRLKSLTQQE
ncbi:hypothetical protein PUN28_011541 [Cardiocondyla obscurior]|uniref:Uncharacterized protein n=1 Tax=Cardiocondyla obscurior TaxID=286306 RepID=A0AAW2FEG5_9HYME